LAGNNKIYKWSFVYGNWFFGGVFGERRHGIINNFKPPQTQSPKNWQTICKQNINSPAYFGEHLKNVCGWPYAPLLADAYVLAILFGESELKDGFWVSSNGVWLVSKMERKVPYEIGK